MTTLTTMQRADREWERLLPVLVAIQADLGGDLSLGELSRRAGLSPFHFHRTFRARIGETVKSYCQRLRLETAAFRLLMHDDDIVQLALEVGFNHHETFTRAFRRGFGCTPSEFRRRGHLPTSAIQSRRACSEDEFEDFELSPTQVVRMRAQHLAFKRHVGPYEMVPAELFDDVAEFVRAKRIAALEVLVGVGWDAPEITDPEKLRFDAAVRVTGPFRPLGEVAYQRLAGGAFALTRFVGPMSSLPDAYAKLGGQLAALEGWRPRGVPVVEIYRTTRINVESRINHTDIYVPVAAT